MLIVIDATGLKCPLPILRLEKALRGMAAGAQVEITASDPMAAIDIPHFVREGGHRLLASRQQGDTHIFTIEKN